MYCSCTRAVIVYVGAVHCSGLARCQLTDRCCVGWRFLICGFSWWCVSCMGVRPSLGLARKKEKLDIPFFTFWSLFIERRAGIGYRKHLLQSDFETKLSNHKNRAFSSTTKALCIALLLYVSANFMLSLRFFLKRAI